MTGLRFRALLWVIMAACIGLFCAASLRNGAALQSNLLALLPATERNPVAEKAISHLADAAGNRVLFLVGHSSDEKAKQAARLFYAELKQSTAFKSVQGEIAAIDPLKLGEIYIRHRFNLLSETDRQELASGDAKLEERLQQKLYAPFRLGLALPVATDPFAFGDNFVNSLPLRQFRLEMEDGLLRTPATTNTPTYIFLSAELSGSAYDSAVQEPAMQTIAAAEQNLRKQFQDVQILHTGTLFYADAARTRAEFEIDLIGAGSLVGILILMYCLFRSAKPLLLGVLSVGFGIGAAYAVTVALNGEIHLITLIFGASLIGEAIDYSIQYFAAHLGAGRQWDPLRGLRMVLPGLSIALGTSLLGYGALSLAPFPAFKQIALFAMVGLSAAYLSVLLLLPALMRQPGRRDPETATAGPQRLLDAWRSAMNPPRCVALIVLCALISLPGWLLLRADDDVRVLITRPAALVDQEQRIRALTGFDGGSQFFLIEGASAEEILQKDEALRARLQPLIANGALSAYQSLSAFVPSAARQSENHQLWQQKIFGDQKTLQYIFREAGLRDSVLQKMNADFAATTNLNLETWLGAPISAPFRQLWLGRTEQGYAGILLPQGARDLRALAAAATAAPGVTWVDKASSVSELFARYRSWGALWLAGTLVLVFILLALRYKQRVAAILLIPAMLGIALALAFFGYARIPLNLFNLMALMLVLGVGVNYAIFLIEGGERQPAAWSGVLLSAGTTLLSFGLLAFSSMPALAGFGLTLLIGIGVAVVFSPMVLTLSPSRGAMQ